MAAVVGQNNYNFCSPEQNNIVRNTTKLSKKDIINNILILTFGLAIAGTLVPINLKIPQPFGWIISVLPGSVALTFIIGGIVEPILIKQRQLKAQMEGNAEKEVKAALCLKHSFFTSLVDKFYHLYRDVFEKGRDSKYFEYVTEEKIRKFFNDLDSEYQYLNVNLEKATEFRLKFENLIFNSKYLNDNYRDLRERFLRSYGSTINSINLGYFSDPFVRDSFVHLTTCTSMQFSTNSLDFVPKLTRTVKTLELTVNEMNDFSQEQTNDTVTTLKVLSLKDLRDLQKITSKFTGIETLTVTCTEVVTEDQVNEVIEALRDSKIRNVTFIPNTPIRNFKFQGSLSWSSLPESIGSKNIVFSRKNNV